MDMSSRGINIEKGDRVMLTKAPARRLTDREIAKIFSSVLGGLASWCHWDDIDSALEHLFEHKKTYIEMCQDIWNADRKEEV